MTAPADLTTTAPAPPELHVQENASPEPQDASAAFTAVAAPAISRPVTSDASSFAYSYRPARTQRTSPLKPALSPVTRRGRLVLAPTAEDLELETANGRFELLGPFGAEVHEGDEVEITGLPDPTSRHPHTLPAMLIQQMRRI